MLKKNEQVKLQTLALMSQLVPAIIGVGSFMVLVRTAQPIVLGQYFIFMAAVVLFEMIKSGGLQSSLVMQISGKNDTQQKIIIGSAYWLGSLFAVSISLVLALLYFSGIFKANPGIEIFCGWYACLGLLTVPLHIAEATAVAKQDLKFLVVLRFIQSTNALLVAAYAYFAGSSLAAFATVHLVFNLILVIAVVALGKTSPLLITHKLKSEVTNLLKLIKYSMATLATTNLLKSADTFLIASLMGPEAVAKYAVPLKLTELFEIPLRSLSTTAFPQLAADHNKQDTGGFKKHFVQYLSWAYLLYIPALTVAFIFAPLIVVILGGSSYEDTAPVFRVFILYGLLLPTDRMSGISLDALHMPRRNFQKVFVMATVNIVGDVLAITLTHDLAWVAFASVLNAATGAFLGCWMLNRTGILAPGNLFKDITAYSAQLIRMGWQKITIK